MLLTVPGNKRHSSPHKATGGTPGFGQEGKEQAVCLGENLYLGSCGKDKTGQGEQFKIS